MAVDETTFNRLKQGDEEAQIALWSLVRRCSARFWSALSDEVHEVAGQVFTELCVAIQQCTVQWNGEPQFAALVRDAVANRVRDWLRRHPVPPSREEPGKPLGEVEVPAAGLGLRPLDPEALLLRRDLDPRAVKPAIELLLAIDASQREQPSEQERLVLHADFWIWLHGNLRRHEQTREAARLVGMEPHRTYNPRSEGKRKVWDSLQSQDARNLFEAVWGKLKNQNDEK